MDLDNPDHLRVLAIRLGDRARAVAAAACAPAGFLQSRLGDETSNLADLLADLTFAVTWQLDEAARRPHQQTRELRRGTAVVARAAIPVGLALAGLGQAVAQLAALHTLDAYEPSDEQQAAVHHTHHGLEQTLRDASAQLAAAERMNHDADHVDDRPRRPPTPSEIATHASASTLPRVPLTTSGPNPAR
ncbi:hypothetical protein [Streptomyces sp. NPDC059209]|uniref:hypothetical protein n=1 Tax=Streptomyces sp. NPDC059209 TaxID=3346769 RepID=UPI003692DA90